MKHRNSTAVALVTAVFALTVFAFPSQNQHGQTNSQAPAFLAPQGTGGKREAPMNLEPIALKLVADRYHASVADLAVTNSVVAHYPDSGKKANLFSISNRRTDEDYEIASDDNGQAVDKAKLIEEDRQTHIAKYGKLSPELTERLKVAVADEEIDVIISLKFPPNNDRPKEPSLDSDRLKRMSDDERKELVKREDEFERQLQEYNAVRARRVIDPIVERLNRLGYSPMVIGDSGNISLKLKPARIREIEKWDEVLSISVNGRAKQALDVSRPTIGADLERARAAIR
jgi:hypothetical protein